MAAGTNHELRTGCRRGDPAALDALLYGCADGLYAMALTVMADEQSAQDCVRESWRRTLARLHGWRFGKNPRDQARRIMFQVLAGRVGADAARSAQRAVLREDGTLGLDELRLPENFLQELSELAHEQAASIQATRRARRRASHGALVALVLIAALVWTAVFVQRARRSYGLTQLKYECLRARIIEQNLVSAMRDAASRLEDPADAERVTAANCERVTLVLEEVANSDSLADLSGLRFIRQRILKHQLADFVRSLSDENDELRRPLRRIALALEEVENL